MTPDRTRPPDPPPDAPRGGARGGEPGGQDPAAGDAPTRGPESRGPESPEPKVRDPKVRNPEERDAAARAAEAAGAAARRNEAPEGGTGRSAAETTSEERQSLWLLAAAPTIWAVHFLASYITNAIWCAKASDPFSDLAWVPTAVAVYTALALAGIGFVGWTGWKRHDYGTAAVPHDFDTRADRHRFMGFATLLLAGLSAIAVVFVAVSAAFFRTCR